jgi:Na+/glutamate symporter
MPAWLMAVIALTIAQLTEPIPPPLRVPELVIAGILSLLGIRSLVKWMGIHFEAESLRDQVLFLLHAASRVGLWFAFAGFFFGFALVEEMGSLVRWYVFVPLGLAGVQLMTAVFLARSPRPTGEARRDGRPGSPATRGSRGGEPASGESGPE